MKRNLIEEIKGIKKRKEDNDFEHIKTNIQGLLEFLEDIRKIKNKNIAFTKYVPVALVASGEAFSRTLVKKLIDFGSPFSDNVATFNQVQNVKFDFNIFSAIQSKYFTLGDFISHILSINNLSDIDIIFSTLTDSKILSEIKKFATPYANGKIAEHQKYMIDNGDVIIKDVIRIYELRHIICHEFANNISLSIDDAEILIHHYDVFFQCLSDFLYFKINPSLSIVDSNIDLKNYLNEEYGKIDSELNDLLNILLLKIENYDKKLFLQSINLWKEYRDCLADSAAKEWEGGTGYSGILASERTEETKAFINHLKTKFDFILTD